MAICRIWIQFILTHKSSNHSFNHVFTFEMEGNAVKVVVGKFLKNVSVQKYTFWFIGSQNPYNKM